ncbi:MAG: hypothetical protein LC744_08270 [Chloroflexi bacterium]|nr:hypothetical protein [Chloroflexota bacterium]
MRMSATRLYASAIAIVSGVYAIGSSTSMLGVGGIGGWVMLVLGLVVLAHGVVLLTPAARSLGAASGPLMLLWGTLMLLQQALAVAMPMSGDMAWDAGMVAIAVLMLVSGVIMSTRRRESRM